MTEQEAIKRIKDQKRLCLQTGYTKVQGITEALDKGIKALEKQLPRTPKVKQLGEDMEVQCPSCCDYHMFINVKRGNNYCSTCGQKLDWGNEDAE